LCDIPDYTRDKIVTLFRKLERSFGMFVCDGRAKCDTCCIFNVWLFVKTASEKQVRRWSV